MTRDGAPPTAATCGPYRAISNALPEFLAVCNALAATLDPVYLGRFDLRTDHAPGGLVALFGSADAFRSFGSESAGLRLGYAGFSLPSRGLVAVSADGLTLERFATTLAHELAHLAHRRVFGSHLPPWLSEGLADAVGDTATPSGFTELVGIEGVEPLARRLLLAIDTDRAEPVAAVIVKSRREFDRATVSYDYETSALAVRFLLLDPELGPRFRTVLDRLADANGCDVLCLLQTIGIDGGEIDARFTRWLRSTLAGEA